MQELRLLPKLMPKPSQKTEVGLMNENKIKAIMSNYGKYDLITTAYQRFKADKEENRNHKADSTTEYLHILEKC